MRMVIQIAKAELRNLFYSPVAWFLAIAFLVQCGWFYTAGMYPLAKGQDISNELYPGLNVFEIYPITSMFFLRPGGIFELALKNLYLFLPLLTMGVISREVNNGTIKLLFSSPVKLRQLVLGKYLALMVYNLVLVGVIGIFMVTGSFNIKSPDYGLLLSAALGFYLLTCAYAAIGLFMSSLSTYQIVSAIGTFVIIFVLSRIGTLWQEIPLVRDLTYFLYLSGRTTRLLKGLIASKDVIYFLLVIYMFLGFTLVRLRNAREKKPWYVKSLRNVMVIASAVLVGYVCSLPHTTLYWDPTAWDQNTIHPTTKKLIDEIGDDELEVTLYANLLGGEVTYGLPGARNGYLTNMWEPYLRFKPNIKFKYVYYYYNDSTMDGGAMTSNFPGKSNEEIAKDVAMLHRVDLKLFKRPDEIKEILDDQYPEGYRLIMKLKYKGRTEFLRTFNDSRAYPAGNPWPDEMNIAATLKRLVHPETKPRVLFTTGHYERSLRKIGQREYWQATMSKYDRSYLLNHGFEIDSIALDKKDIPDGIAALVIADPRSVLSETEQQKIRDYIDKGGNMLIMGEPGKQEILNPLLSYLGVKFLDGTLVEPTFNEMPQMVRAIYTPVMTNISDEPVMQIARMKLKDKYSRDTSKMLMPGVTAIAHSDSNGFTMKPLLVSNGGNSWIRKGELVTDSAAITYHPEEGDVKGAFPTGIQLIRQVGNKQQRIVVTGDADFISNQRLMDAVPALKTIFHFISNDSYPVYLTKPNPRDNKLKATGKSVKFMNILYVWVLPALLIIAATVLLIRRKRK